MVGILGLVSSQCYNSFKEHPVAIYFLCDFQQVSLAKF